MKREEITKAIQAALQNNRLSCEKAHEISAALNVSLEEVGKICNDLKIKIASCQLGCF